MAIVTDYYGWGKSHNGKGVGNHIAGEQYISTNPHGNGRTTSRKATAEELEQQRRNLRRKSFSAEQIISEKDVHDGS